MATASPYPPYGELCTESNPDPDREGETEERPGRDRGETGERPGRERRENGERTDPDRGETGERPGIGRGLAGDWPGIGRGLAGDWPGKGRGETEERSGVVKWWWDLMALKLQCSETATQNWAWLIGNYRGWPPGGLFPLAGHQSPQKKRKKDKEKNIRATV